MFEVSLYLSKLLSSLLSRLLLIKMYFLLSTVCSYMFHYRVFLCVPPLSLCVFYVFHHCEFLCVLLLYVLTYSISACSYMFHHCVFLRVPPLCSLTVFLRVPSLCVLTRSITVYLHDPQLLFQAPSEIIRIPSTPLHIRHMVISTIFFINQSAQYHVGHHCSRIFTGTYFKLGWCRNWGQVYFSFHLGKSCII